MTSSSSIDWIVESGGSRLLASVRRLTNWLLWFSSHCRWWSGGSSKCGHSTAKAWLPTIIVFCVSFVACKSPHCPASQIICLSLCWSYLPAVVMLCKSLRRTNERTLMTWPSHLEYLWFGLKTVYTIYDLYSTFKSPSHIIFFCWLDVYHISCSNWSCFEAA